ncbi:MAG TPA: hypothetical protein VHF27_03425 [Acidimicrobiales bacterium]|nr:hypothetical protein [Acidimicrobiales bacterium]
MIRRAAAVALTGVLVAGCGGASPGAKALDETETKLEGIRSGRLSLLLLASPVTAAEGQGAGFQVEGPFAVGEKKGSLPVADLRYTRITGTERRTTRFVSTGTRAFVEVDGRLTELHESQLADLRVSEEGSSGGLGGLSLGTWLDDPQLAAGPPVDGVPTDQVSGKADAVAILNDLIALTQQFGAGDASVQRLEGDAAERVRRAVAGTRAEVVTGREDRLLRRADVSVDLALSDPRVRDALGDLAGARLALSLEVTELNRPVEVAVPQPQGGRR